MRSKVFENVVSRLVFSLISSIFILILGITPTLVSADELPPVQDFSTYLGGNSSESGKDVALDAQGNIYVTGFTQSPDFPASNPFNVALPNGTDNVIYVTKFDPMGTRILYSVYLGKGKGESLAVDADGYVYVTGSAEGAIALKNPMQATLKIIPDIFVTKLNPAGNALVFSTYLGGDGMDIARGLALDASKNIYLAGQTQSTDFPTRNPYQVTSEPFLMTSDAFVTKLNPSGSALIYSTYYGGTNHDVAEDIAVNGNEVFITGGTYSSDFPTVNPYQGAISPNSICSLGNSDGFVARFNASGVPVYSTYLGGNGCGGAAEKGIGIAVDASGSAYVVGRTHSANFPTVNAYQDTLANLYAGFITRFSPDGTQLLYSTYLGGTASEVYSSAIAIAVDVNGLIYVAGVTNDSTFPTARPLQASLTNPGGLSPTFDMIAAVLSADGQTLLFSTYWGGSMNEYTADGLGMAFSSQGSMVITGATYSTDFPTAFAVQDTPSGPDLDEWQPNFDSVVMKIGLTPITAFGVVPQQGYFATHTPTLTWTSLSGADKYHIQVSLSPTFDAPLEFDAEVSGNDLSVETDALVNGRHYWRVQAKQLDGQVSGWSGVQSFTVRA